MREINQGVWTCFYLIGGPIFKVVGEGGDKVVDLFDVEVDDK